MRTSEPKPGEQGSARVGPGCEPEQLSRVAESNGMGLAARIEREVRLEGEMEWV